jgi:5-methylcytosine-specific restriction endonuclease McrA
MDAHLRQSVRARAAYHCEYCRLPQEFSELRFHIEHVIPRQHGGGDDADNLALACPDCNLRKGPNLTGIDPETREVVRLFHPRRDVWSDHFRYEASAVVGATAVGRTTISLLQMNDPERRRVRELIGHIQG